MQLALAALVGLDLAQQALLLLAVEPRLKGLLLAAGAGTGKSSLARGFADLLPDVPFVELPASVDVDNLIGYPDLERTLQTGALVFQDGVLSRAHGGGLHVDGINLLSDAASNLLLGAIEDGHLQVEREGVSRRVSAEFSLIASYDPTESTPRRHLMDRVGLIVTLPAQQRWAERAEVIRRNLLGQQQSWQEETDFLRGLVETAREQLPHVTIDDAQVEQLTATALAYGVEGHRADLFAMRTACAAAALALRDVVSDEDLALAVQLVIVPRATQLPAPPQEEEYAPQPEQKEGADSAENSPQQTDPDQEDDAANQPQKTPTIAAPDEQIFEIAAADLPVELLDMPFQHVRRGRTGSRGSTAAKRGRHVRSVPGNPRHHRIDIAATLRAAAPWQTLRKRTTGQQANQSSNSPIHLELGDVRVKQYRSKAGALFVFVVDASGSMALHRMQQAKGAVQLLLEQAYVNRDRVALITCRGDVADVSLQPTQSVANAQRTLEIMPTGGGTPLASALIQSIELAQQAAGRGIMQTVLVVMTDGRANVALTADGDVNGELETIGRKIAGSAIRPIVVDTQRSFLSNGEAKQLAQWLGAEYAYLPQADAGKIVDLATTTSQRTAQ